VTRAAIEAIKKYGTGRARLLTGTTDQHQQIEQDLAAFRGTEADITFSSGYAANVAVIPNPNMKRTGSILKYRRRAVR
jgi:7-keto-8-aminopelargonate synthetase-like enzyme